jgi:hypothetical protein
MAFGTFLQAGASSVPFNLTAFDDASQVGTATETGVLPPGVPLAFGGISFSGPASDRVALGAPTADSFWILDGNRGKRGSDRPGTQFAIASSVCRLLRRCYYAAPRP